MSKRPTVLMILDGYGLNDRKEANAIAEANTPVMDKLMAEYPYVKGNASGLAVGLPDGQMGNSEVGHMNMGAGRIVYQELTRITKEIQDGDFFKNEALLEAMDNAKKNDSALHLYGLLSDGGVHSHNTHLYALLEMAKQQGLYLPVVYNTSSYEKVETLRLLEGYVDIYLPDLKYVDSAISSRYSHAADYFTCASAAIAEMVRQVGEPEFVFERAAGKEGSSVEFLADEKKKILEQQNNMIFDAAEYQERSEAGESLLMRKGVIVRHLVMPDCVEDSKRVISYLLKTYGGQIFISIMNQYTPLPQCREYPELSRRVTEAEYDAVVDYAIELGIENGFIQEGDVAEESFIPEFDGEGIVRKDVDR